MRSQRTRLAETVDRACPDFSGVAALRVAGADTALVARGHAHRPSETPNIETTRFGIASGTKGFTAAAVLNLVGSGRISLDAPITEYIPGVFPRFSPSITVRHLLTHTSGVPDYCDEEAGCDFEALWVDRPVYTMRNIEDFLPLFAAEPMKFEPGTRFCYSNSGFLILGLIIERVTGRRYVDHVTEEVFERMEMTSSGFFAADMLPPNTATGYLAVGDSFRSNIFSIPVIGSADGGAYTTACDMLRFWDAIFRDRYLPEEQTEELRRVYIDDTGETGHGYSLGFWRYDVEEASRGGTGESDP